MVRKTQEGFPRQYRIVRGADFCAAYEDGVKLHRPHLVLFARPNALGHPRLGITVTRRVGSAVVRNRIKRLFRDIFRRAAGGISKPLDFVVNAKRGAEDLGHAGLRKELLAAIAEACCRASTDLPSAPADGTSGTGGDQAR